MQNYQKGKKLGQGSFGDVYIARKRVNDDTVAIKEIKGKHQHSKQLQVLKWISSVNTRLLVKLLDSFYCNGQLVLVMEYCPQGNLLAWIDKNERKPLELKYQEIETMFTRIVRGFKHLYQQNVLHRDIKPQNVLVKDGLPKIADFGASKIDRLGGGQHRTWAGSDYYMAPQMLQRKAYTNKADIYSLGVLLLHMYKPTAVEQLHKQMVRTKSTRSIEQFIIALQLPLEDLLLRMLVYEAEARMTWDQLFEYFEMDVRKVRKYKGLRIDNMVCSTYQQYKKVMGDSGEALLQMRQLGMTHCPYHDLISLALAYHQVCRKQVRGVPQQAVDIQLLQAADYQPATYPQNTNLITLTNYLYELKDCLTEMCGDAGSLSFLTRHVTLLHTILTAMTSTPPPDKQQYWQGVYLTPILQCENALQLCDILAG